MNSFKKVLKKRLIIMIALNGLAVILIALTSAYGNIKANGNANLSDMIRGFQVGIFIGLQLMLLIFITRYGKALKSEDQLKKLYIVENDERKKLIQDKIGGAGFNFTIGAAATATVMAGYFNQLVFITLLGVLVFMVLVKGVLKLYYRYKF